MNLTKLVEAAKQKDEAAIEILLKRVSHKGKFIALDYLKNEYAAEEALQLSFIQAYSNLDHLKNPEKFDKWFYMILNRQCTNLYNKNKKAPVTFSMFDSEDMNFEDAVQNEYMAFEPKGSFDYSQLLASVRDALDELPDAQRQAIYAYYIQKMTFQQIADIDMVAESTIRARIDKGLKRLAATVKRLEDQMAAFFLQIFQKNCGFGFLGCLSSERKKKIPNKGGE